MTFLIYLVLSTFSIHGLLANGPTDLSPLFVPENSLLTFDGPTISIILTFNTTVDSSCFIGQDLMLSNDVNFSSVCTFASLQFTVDIEAQAASVHILMLSILNSTTIRSVIGNNPDVECLADFNSTFLLISPILPLPNQLNVIPDTSPPRLFSLVIDFQLGTLTFIFDEPTILETFNTSEISLLGTGILQISDLTNAESSIETTVVSVTYTILLEVSEISLLHGVCVASCNLFRSITFADDVIILIPNQFILSDWGIESISILVSPLGFKQANVSFSAPVSLRQNDSVFYRVFLLPEQVEYYYGSCEQASGYHAQLDSHLSTLGFIFYGSLPCENTSEYLCFTTSSLSLAVDIIQGANQYICVETVYTDLNITNTPCYIMVVSEWYQDILNLEIATDFGADSQPENSSLPFPLENRVLLTWNISDLSFCDYHRMTVRYTQSPLYLHNIEVDTDTLCGDQFLYIYIPANFDQELYSVATEIRFISPSSITPENTCRYTTISFGLFVQSFTDVIDVPVIESIGQLRSENGIVIVWSSFRFTQMEHFNIYIFPVHALRHENSSCNDLRSDTRAEEFSLLTTEYYNYGVSVPGRIQFNLTCPPTPGSSLPYQCHSATSNDRRIDVGIDYTYAVGVIIEAVLLNPDTGVVTKVRSYPAIHSAISISLGEQGLRYQEVFWNPDFCFFSSSIVFRIFFDQFNLNRRSTRELGIIPDFVGNKIFPCERTSAFLLDVPTSFSSYAYVFSEIATQDGAACLSGFESNFVRSGNFELFDRVVDFRYLDYNTVSLSIAIFGMFNQPATVYFLPFQVHRFGLDNVTDQCPSIVDGTDLTFSFNSIFENNSLVLSSFLPCENTSFYSCISVDTTVNIVVDVIPGFDFAIRINSSTVDTFSGNGILELDDSTLLKRQSLLYTNTQLISNTSALIEWDTAFYCPPDSYIYITWGKDVDPPITFPTSNPSTTVLPPLAPEPPQRRRREVEFDTRTFTLECGVGSYIIDNLAHSSEYFIQGKVFFNSTAFFPTCPTFQILFDPVTTPDFFQEIKLVDFANVEVKWNLVPGVSNYTLMAVPVGVVTYSDQINSVFSTSFLDCFTDYNSSITFPMEVLSRYCFELNATLTCSRLVTSLNSAVLSIIPGYEYAIVVVYEQDGVNIFENYPKFFFPGDFVDVSISEFGLSYLFQYDSQVCTNTTRFVFYFIFGGESDGLFRVDSCFNSSAELSSNERSFPQVLFILPYQPIQFPDPSITPVNPTHIAIFSFDTLSFLPLSAAPVVTAIQSPADSSVDLYQAEWKSLHSFIISQQFESYTLYAFPSSREFSLSDQECPEYIYPGCFLSRPISPLTTRRLLTDVCPSNGTNYYFCKEFSALEGNITLFPLLDYNIFVEAVYDGGLRAYRQQAGVNVTASLTLLETLNLTYTVTTSSIDIYWDTTAVFCVDSTIAFLYSTQIDASLVVDCQLGFYSIGSLRSRTEYEIYVYFNYIPTRLYRESQCIRSNPQIAFSPSPVTASFCLTQQPCQGLGMCSEGISTGSYVCDCLTGYEFNGITCVDINECSSPVSPCVNSACVNSIGSYTCVCFNGFVSVNGDCVDIDECNLPGYCVNGICTNLLPPENYRCDCVASYTGSACNISTLTNPLCAAITESNQFGVDLTFPATPVGSDGNIPCSQLDNALFGMISKPCSSVGVRGDTDFQNCLSASFVALQRTAAPLTREESVIQSQQLVSATGGVFLYPGEVRLAAAELERIRDSLLNLTRDELTDALSQVQDSIVRIASNVFSSRIAFTEIPMQEAESEISSIVTTVESLGLLLGSILPVNSSVVIEERNVALVVVVVSGNIEGIFIGPSSVSDQSALSRGRASVSIPASVLQANDVGEGVEVSFSVFPSLSQLLGEVEAEVPRSDRETSVNDSIATAVINLNIFTRGVGRVEQLNGEILLSFGLLFDPPVIQNNIKFSIAYTCVSTQSVADDWVANGTVLANSPQVPPGPAQCSVTHLTNFAVLVSALSLNLTPQERLGIEILSYLLGSISIVFLSLSLISYFILWIRTRKQSTSLFKKDATILHCNFAVALLIALVFFLASGGAYSNRQACLAVTIIQYYFWLSVFTASFSIGLYLFIKIFAWGVERRFWHFLVALSWALPIPLLIITPAITHEYIIDDIDEICWLSNEPTFVSLAFIIPMAVMTLLNVVALIVTAIVLFKISRGKGNVYVQLRGVLLATFILAPLLGLPWLFSIFATIPSPATAFIFTIVLGLQGVVFAVLYPLRTPEILMYVFKWKPVHSSVSFSTVSNSKTGSNPSNKPPPSLKFRINRRGDGENTSANPTLETKNEYLGIQLEPVTVESSLRLVQNQKKIDLEKSSQVIPNPRYGTSVSVPGEDATSSRPHSIKVPYESLPIHHGDSQ